MWVRVLVGVLLLIASGAQAGKLYPVDESGQDPSFAAFRKRLIAAVRRRDARFVRSILDPEIELSFGGLQGRKDFEEMWHPERRDSELWPVLDQLLKLGGAYDRRSRTFTAPYVFTAFPDDMDAFEHSAIVGKGVNVRAQPSCCAAVIGTLSYDIVRVAAPEPEPEPGGKHSWVAITLPNGRRGYVDARFIRSPIDYRAQFTKVRGRWRMTFLLAGD